MGCAIAFFRPTATQMIEVTCEAWQYVKISRTMRDCLGSVSRLCRAAGAP